MRPLAQAQTVTPDLFSPARDGLIAPQDSPLRRTGGRGQRPIGGCRPTPRPRDQDRPAPSRIGQIPTYGLPAASGAVGLRLRLAQPQAQEAEILSGAGQAEAAGRVPAAAAAGRLEPAPVRLSIPPSQSANKTPIPPAMAGTVVGQPPRKRLKIDDDPFGAVGDYAGSFLVKSARRTARRLRHQSRPHRRAGAARRSTWSRRNFWRVSDWERHALVADLRGSFTGYGNTFPPVDGVVSSAPTNVDRPDFTGHVDGRLDVTHDTRLLGQARLRVATDNPGSPNIQAGLARYPLYATFGGTLGVDQNFNRLQVSAGATVDRTVYQNSQLTDGTLDHQRRPQLQPVWRRRARQLRSDAGPQAVRRDRGRHPLARPAGRSQRLPAQFRAAAIVKAGTTFRTLAAPDRRSLDRLCGAHL